MSVNRLFYTVKLESTILKEYKYDLNLSFKQCVDKKLIISLSDSQMLKSIRDITHHEIDRELLEEWYTERNRLKKRSSRSYKIRKRINAIQDDIYNMMYIPEYITVVMDSKKDYEHMFKKGFKFNGKLFTRGSCSASQARVSTIVFVQDDIKEELLKRLNNGRDVSHPLAPSKYNAYLGLYSSASKAVTKPRFCIVPDYIEHKNVDVSFSIETENWDIDDIIEDRTVDTEFNRFDGCGLVSPQMAEIWGRDLGEDYTPSQFCIRYSFTKGLTEVFDFVEWCRDELEGIKDDEERFFITDIYGKKRDLREVDVVLTEGMAKLWDSWESQEQYEACCEENGIDWRITKYAPKQDKELGLMNYQYLQTLNLNDEDIKKICQDTVDYVQGVSYSDIYYTLLFCLGQGMGEEDIQNYMASSDNYWIKSMVLNHEILNDKYSKEHIRDMIVTRISQACLGRLMVNGNYQAIIADPYGLCQWITGQEVTGLLEDGEFYSQFWAKKDIDTIACARSPQTYRSEWVIAKNKYKADDDSEYEIKRAEKIKKYYQYSYSGIITNKWGQYTMNFAGSDFDFDILFTTNCQEVINNTYKNERVTAYDVPKPKKKPNLTEEDLYISDTFSFGQQIGPLTNISTAIYSLLPRFKEGSKEYNKLIERLKQCCVNQSKQIDKTKIGQDVKCIPKIWVQKQYYYDKDTLEEHEEKTFYNSILADKKPYFFKYKYKTLDKEIREYDEKYEDNCLRIFAKTLKELKSQDKDTLNEKELEFLGTYEKYYPAIDTDCVMNNICKYIEDIDFHIKKKVRGTGSFDHKTLQSPGFVPKNERILKEQFDEDGVLITDDKGNPIFIEEKSMYEQLLEELDTTFKTWEKDAQRRKKKKIEKSMGDGLDDKFNREVEYVKLRNRLDGICENSTTLANYLVHIFYVTKPSYNKSVMWGIVGEEIFNTLKDNTDYYYFPVKDENGSLEFCYEKYQIKKLEVIQYEPEIEVIEQEVQTDIQAPEENE